MTKENESNSFHEVKIIDMSFILKTVILLFSEDAVRC